MEKIKKKKKYRIMWITFSIITVLILSVIVFINQPQFGRLPSGERKERIKNSPNYRNGKFQNLSETKQITSDKGFLGTMTDFLFSKTERLRPDKDLPVIKTDLWNLGRENDYLVWFGHSSVFIQVDGKRILVDPVLISASPVSFVNKAFKGTSVYKPGDIPEIDYLVISHDHWDHLDYKTVKSIKDRVGKVICGLGVGEHFERWGFDKDRIVEMDWNESAVLDSGFTVYCLPARHFSGRGLSPNQSLWASFMMQTPLQKIYIGGDSGYDKHYADISKQFGKIDLAVLENGQYNEDWRYIHMLPADLVQAAKDLNADRLLTVHHSKYALGRHPWDEPIKNITQAAREIPLNLMAPEMGELVMLNGQQAIKEWWKE